jgi:hypothetical protein
MAAVIQSGLQIVKDTLNPYLGHSFIGLFLGILERILHVDRSFITLGIETIVKIILWNAYSFLGTVIFVAIYLVVGWGNDFLCNFIGMIYPAYAS